MAEKRSKQAGAIPLDLLDPQATALQKVLVLQLRLNVGARARQNSRKDLH